MKPDPSFHVTFSVPQRALQELFAGGNRGIGWDADPNLARNFGANAIEHACEELKILGELLCAAPEELDVPRLGNRLWRIAMQIEAAQVLADALKGATLEQVCECSEVFGSNPCALHYGARRPGSEAAE